MLAAPIAWRRSAWSIDGARNVSQLVKAMRAPTIITRDGRYAAVGGKSSVLVPAEKEMHPDTGAD